MASSMSPDGYYYQYTPSAPAGQRLARRTTPQQPWATFSIQHTSAAELRFVAALIDEARHDQRT